MKQRNGYDREGIRSGQNNAHAALAVALGLALTAISGGGHAATQVLMNCNDSGSGSLRAAIAAATSGDIIDASGLACSTISLSTGALAVTVNDLTVIGAGREYLTVTNGAKYGRVFSHSGTGLLNLRGMTITGGVVSPAAPESATRGGCIYSAGSVTLGNIFDPTDKASGVAVSDCNAVSTQAGVTAAGGGIFAKSGVGLANSTVTHSNAVAQSGATYSRGGGIALDQGPFAMKYSEVSNCAANGTHGDGGGIDAPFVDTVTVKHSTIAGNSSTGRAGGAYLGTDTGGLVLIDNSTISGNRSAGEGGVVLNVQASATQGAIHIYSSTITQNESTSTKKANSIGGAAVFGSTIWQSTIVSGNFKDGMNSDVRSDTNAGANNLVGVSLGTMPPTGLIIATDPELGALTNRGGPTRVHEPLANSPAINTGNNNAGASADQRGPGFSRTLGAGADIGAVERNPDTIFANAFD